MEQHRIEVALMPPTSSFAPAVKAAVERLDLPLVPVDAATPADLAERVLVVDLTKRCRPGLWGGGSLPSQRTRASTASR